MLNDVYRAIFSFSHPAADGDISFSCNWALAFISTSRTEAQYAQDIAQNLVDEFEATYLPLIGTGYTFNQVDVLNLNQPQYGNIATSGQAGTVAQEVVSLRSAVVVSKRTGMRGRSRRGRMFMCAPCETQQNGGVLESSYVTSLQTFLTSLLDITLANGNNYNAVLTSEVLAQSFNLTAFLVRDTLGSIRGRQRVS